MSHKQQKYQYAESRNTRSEDPGMDSGSNLDRKCQFTDSECKNPRDKEMSLEQTFFGYVYLEFWYW
jgi:hypothetical protein